MLARHIELEPATLVGRFRVTCEIGRGGHGVVYAAHDTLLGREVALKIRSIRGLSDAEIAATENEACLLSQVDSPHVSAIHDLVRHGDSVVLVMELVSGPTLAAKARQGCLPWTEVVAIGVQLARGLCALHEAGIVHQDIKPSNIRLSRTGLLKILDFGIARRRHAIDLVVEHDNAGAPVVGTIPYMSPERLRGHPADARSDIYGCGSVLYELTTGRRIFDVRSGGIRRQNSAHPVPPSMIASGIPGWFEEIIWRAVEPNPDERYQTARDLLVALTSEDAPATCHHPIACDVDSGSAPAATFDLFSSVETTSTVSIAPRSLACSQAPA